MKRLLSLMLTLLLMLSIHMGALAAEPNESSGWMKTAMFQRLKPRP